MRFMCNVLRDESGATTIEYVVITALLSIGAIAAMTSAGGHLSTFFSKTSVSMY